MRDADGQAETSLIAPPFCVLTADGRSAVGVLSSSEAQPALVDPDSVDRGSATTQELRKQWRKAEARTELFERNSQMWREAREEADVARRAYEGRLRTLLKTERSENP